MKKFERSDRSSSASPANAQGGGAAANSAEYVDGDAWLVDCGERGVIRAKQVIVCTNAHTRHLFPGEPVDKQ